MRGVNQITGMLGGGTRGKQTTWPVLKARRRQQMLAALIAAIEGSLQTGRIVIESDKHAAELARWETVITYHLVTTHRMAIPEAVQLLRLLREQGLDFCPLLAIKGDLSALQHANREIIEPRDQYDITRAACALPYADIYVTDGGKAAAIRELKLDKKYGTEVFSTKPGDVVSFRQKLETLLRRVHP